jgi:4-hydroxybenzoyl-CoA thioesterase
MAETSSRAVTYRVQVEFGDCDPARIVWFPNFFRWIDVASRHFFIECGVPPWHDTERSLGVIGTPLVDTHARFVKTASYGDALDIHTRVTEWRDKSFVQNYRIERTNTDATVDVIMECDEVRIFAARREGTSNGIRAVAVPEAIRALCNAADAQ